MLLFLPFSYVEHGEAFFKVLPSLFSYVEEREHLAKLISLCLYAVYVSMLLFRLFSCDGAEAESF